MGSPRQKSFVNNTNIAATAITTTQPSPDVLTTGFPVGDVVYKNLALRLDGTLSITSSSAGTIITRGGLQFLRSLMFETDKHGMLIEGLDGIMLHNIQTVRNGARPLNTDITSAATGTPAYEYGLKLDFEDPNAARPEDTGLDMYAARPTLTCQYGIFDDFVSGGTNSVESVNAYRRELHVNMDPGPINVVKDGPLAMPHLGIRKVPISDTATKFQIILPFGDRNLKRLHITQRNSSTLAEVANTICGANNGDRLDVKVNGFSWINNVQWIALQDENASDYRLSAMPTGMAVADFVPRRSSGYKYADALSLVTNVQGTAEIDIDVTTVTNGQLWIGIESVKPIPPAALRPKPTA